MELQERDTVQMVRDVYAVLCNRQLGDDADGVARRVDAVRWLERTIGVDFKDTADFHSKVSQYLLNGGGLAGNALYKARVARRWTRNALAASLGCSVSLISLMEQGIRPLNDAANRFVLLQAHTSGHKTPFCHTDTTDNNGNAESKIGGSEED